MDLINIYDYEKEALKKLPKMVGDYYASGANDEITLQENHRAYDRLKLKYKVLRDISERDISTSILGQDISMPLIVAPTAFHKMAHPQGEIATAQGVGNMNTIMILSTLSTCSIEEVTQSATSPIWFQLYVYRDREATRELVKRAEKAGCKAIVLTVDAQIWGHRERDTRNKFTLPKGLEVKNLDASGKGFFPDDSQGSGLSAYVHSLFDPSLNWKDLDWLCGLTHLPVLVKGVAHSDDAVKAIEHGAKGIIVSNHGGRQLDTAPATIEVLPEITEAVQGRVPILIDGGIRRGTDVIKAVALGAQAVAVGRPILWGLTMDGAQGVERVLDILRIEIDLALGLCGASNLSEVNSDLIF